MKRILSVVLLLVLLLCGCDSSMNWVISNEPSVWGIVEQIGGETVAIRVTKSDDPVFAPGDLVHAEMGTRLNDGKFSARVGDEVAVYYDSGTPVRADKFPNIRDVHGYCLITPANREGKE